MRILDLTEPTGAAMLPGVLPGGPALLLAGHAAPPAERHGSGLPSVGEVQAFAARIGSTDLAMGDDLPVLDDATRIELISALETLKSAAAAAQARLSVAFARSQKAGQIAAGIPAARASLGVATQLGLARRESPNKAVRLLGLARCLVEEMPHTLNRLACGDTSEWRATLIVRETAVLSREARALVDDELCGPSGPIAALGDGGVERAARTIGYRLEPGSAWKRARQAEVDRRVTIRPAPDCMAIITAHLPVGVGVAAYAALSHTADVSTLAGDTRGRGQIMADTLATRILQPAQPAPAAPTLPAQTSDGQAQEDRATDDQAPAGEGPDRQTSAGQAPEGQAPNGQTPEGAADSDAETHAGAHFFRAPAAAALKAPAASGMPVVPVQINLVMTDQTLFADSDEPAHLNGFGPIPAPLARHLARGAPDRPSHPDGPSPRADTSPDDNAEVWVRRLYTAPRTGELIGMESRARHFPARLREYLITRDQFCRTPWCDAPIRQTDHIRPAAHGGPTTATNGQGLCHACNLTKEALGWKTETNPDISPDAEHSTGHGTGPTTGPSTGPSTGSSTRPSTGHSVRITTPTGRQYLSRPPRLPGPTPTRPAHQ